METKTAGVCVGKQRNDKVARVAIKNAFIIVTFVDQLVQALLLATEGHTVRTHMRRHKGVNGLAVFIELNATCAIVEVKHRIQRVVIHRFLRQAFCGCRCQNSVTPLRTFSISLCVPMSSKRYSHGTPHF